MIFDTFFTQGYDFFLDSVQPFAFLCSIRSKGFLKDSMEDGNTEEIIFLDFYQILISL